MARRKPAPDQDDGELLLREAEDAALDDGLIDAGLEDEDDEETKKPVVVPTGYLPASYRLTGKRPLLMHNGQLADPLGTKAKELKRVTGKNKKTDADYALMAEIEFKGSLYLDEKHGPIIPGLAIEAMFVEAGKKLRLGQQVKAGLLCEQVFALEYDGPRDADKLWADGRFRLTSGVKVKQSRVMRTRPIFHQWAVTITVEYEPTTLNKAQVDEILTLAGKFVGLLDWRPKYGRFDVKIL